MATQADPQPQPQQQPEAQSGGKKPDRTMTIICRPTLQIASATPPYSMTATPKFYYDSGTPPMDGRVHEDGDIILQPLPSPQDFSNQVDITVMLDTSLMVDPEGNHVPGRWAYANEYSGIGPVTGFCWFCRITNVEKRGYNSTPIEVNGMSATRISDTEIFMDDNSPAASPAVGFCLGLVVPQYSDYYITIDPILTSKTGLGKPPM